ncbi:hypothetical protein, variant 2 [Phytophthora nicotianae P10297]|uniref:Uncharacterized protein n=1 Tax=Phytophthora nicotianae P10297 TaxID=1317064 RepID=W2Z7L9_PHYNI|nr:hypothetical protein, variant 2 [Phytophthora nicotianae P10297]
MKRKQATAMATTSSEDKTSPSKKKVKASETNARERNAHSQEVDEVIDVQGFLLQECQASSKKLVEQAKLRAAELRQEMEEGKKVLLDALEAEKENLGKDGNAIPRAFTIFVRAVSGPYRGRKFSMDIDVVSRFHTARTKPHTLTRFVYLARRNDSRLALLDVLLDENSVHHEA